MIAVLTSIHTGRSWPEELPFLWKAPLTTPPVANIREQHVALVALVVLLMVQTPRGKTLANYYRYLANSGCGVSLTMKEAVIIVSCQNATDWGPCCSAEYITNSKCSQQRDCCELQTKQKLFLKFKKAKSKKKQTPLTLSFIRHKNCLVFY